MNKEQLVDDMLQDQPEELHFEQKEGFADDGKARIVNDEPLVDNMLQNHQEEGILNVSTSPQLSAYE